MDKKFLDKVVGQLVYETIMDYDMEEIQFPFLSFTYPLPYLLSLPFYSSIPLSSYTHSSFYFFDHCKTVYGLNDNEIEYVWKEYKEIVNDKISQ